MVSSAAICLLLSRPRPSEGGSCWHNIYTYIDEHIKPKFEEFGFPLDDNYFYVGKYKDCRLSISIIHSRKMGLIMYSILYIGG